MRFEDLEAAKQRFMKAELDVLAAQYEYDLAHQALLDAEYWYVEEGRTTND